MYMHDGLSGMGKGRSLQRKGFALIATISVMVLMVMVALAMLSLNVVELRSSKNGQMEAEAQANARTALMFALADLQRQLGPDSRISAPHDSGNIAPAGQPNWVAVYDAWTQAEDGVREDPANRDPKFRGWLVSGVDETTGLPVDSNAPEIELLSTRTLNTGADEDDVVRVPSVAMANSARNGRLAWWVSDEGVKAKVNAGPADETLASFGKADSLFRSQSPIYMGHQAVSQLENFTWDAQNRAATVSSKTLNLAAGLGANGLGSTVHDITVNSTGLLTDVRAGRLKRDLSTLLSRPIEELEDKPLYVADGRMNNFQIGENGSFVNGSGIPDSWGGDFNGGGHWGINMEELHLYHSLSRSLDWSSGTPSLTMPSTREVAVRDRHFLYKRPAVEAMQFIFSLKAVEDPRNEDRYKMEMHMDALVALSNPNDVPLVYSPGLLLPIQLLWLPYDLQWKMTNASSTFKPPKLQTFKGFVGGQAAQGFTLEPGEAAVFGTGIANSLSLDLTRGFVPGGEVTLRTGNWGNLGADNLELDESVDFEFLRKTETHSDGGNPVWLYTNIWLGPRDNTGASGAWQMDDFGFVNAPGAENDAALPPTIGPSQVLRVSDYLEEAKPVFLLTVMKNVEKSSNLSTPDAFPSRPYQLDEPAVCRRVVRNNVPTDGHGAQMLVTAESLDFTFKSLAAGQGGRNIYVGGGRQPAFGGSFHRIGRRIPFAPPLSIAAFQHGIAAGFSDHWNDNSERKAVGGNGLNTRSFPSNAAALSGHVVALPVLSSPIGNSMKIPEIAKGKIYETGGVKGMAVNYTAAQIASDHSWLANTALWDTWFLSSVVDGTGDAETAYQTDARTARAQFSDLANGVKSLRNSRYKFYAHKSADDALNELFDGEEPSARSINLLAKYLLVDGAFNVNSTSEVAWEVMLSSVRDQELLNSDGDPESFDHPFGTVGYATESASSGTQGDWTGLRDLSESEIRSLARAIVTEVKERGPFLSMGDFVNRRPNSSNSEHQVMGALQAAIDKAGLNSDVTAGDRELTSMDFGALPGSAGIEDEPAPVRSVGSPGHLSQGDVLTAIGSQITVRSDTFVIRAYGDARDVNDRVVARAWCEAVVQRLPEYVDSTDAPEAQDGWPTSEDTLTEANKLFGRRFEIQSFRWLNADEI